MVHFKVFTDSLTRQQKDTIILNTSCPELARFIFGKEIAIETVPDQNMLQAEYEAKGGVRSFKSTRFVNLGLPFNIHALVCAALGIPVAANEEIRSALLGRSGFGNLRPSPVLSLPSYCVLHLEWARTGHDGRVPSRITLDSIARISTDIFDHVVFVGKGNLLKAEDFAGSKANIIDMQGKLSISSLIGLVSGASAFVGIDSFPAHIAQAADVPSAIFFGSVHPTFRILSQNRTWPIVKPIGCIGCYHVSLEPGTPFCMRRDLSCTDIDYEILQTAISGCASMETFDWHFLTSRALELQRRFFMKMLFHPVSERRFFDTKGVSIKMMSNLIDHIINGTQDAVLSSLRVGLNASSTDA